MPFIGRINNPSLRYKDYIFMMNLVLHELILHLMKLLRCEIHKLVEPGSIKELVRAN